MYFLNCYLCYFFKYTPL